MDPRRPPFIPSNNSRLIQGNQRSHPLQPLPTNQPANPPQRTSSDTKPQTHPTPTLLQTPNLPCRDTDTSSGPSSGHSSAETYDPYHQYKPPSSAARPPSRKTPRHQPTYPVSYNPVRRPDSNLCDQTFFLYSFPGKKPFISKPGYPPLADHEVDFLKKAIRIAYRLVFSAKSIDVLHYIIDGGAKRNPNRSPELVSALDALAQKDGMWVVLDCESMQAGFVLSNDPRCLRISAILVNQALRIRHSGDVMCIKRHMFFLSSVVAHLICGSIRHLVAGLNIKGWRWENNCLGGRIERIVAPSAEGKIEQLVVSCRDGRGAGWTPLPDATVEILTQEPCDWERCLPLVPLHGRLEDKAHPRLLQFHEVMKGYEWSSMSRDA